LGQSMGWVGLGLVSFKSPRQHADSSSGKLVTVITF